jgi:nucleoid DNA-binding protein
MNKSDLIDALVLDQNLLIKTAVAIVATVLDAMPETLFNGGNEELREAVDRSKS